MRGETITKLNKMQKQIICDHVPWVGEGGKETGGSKENLQKKLKNAERNKTPKVKTKKFPKELIKRERTLRRKKDSLALLIVEKAKEKIVPDLVKFFEAQTKEIRSEIAELDDFANGLESRISELEIRTGLMPPINPNLNETMETLAKKQKKIFEVICKDCGKELKEGHKCEPEPEHFDLHDKIIPK